MKKLIILGLLLAITSNVAFAESNFQLQFPVKCSINRDCWIVNYVDNDSSSNWHDYRNGRETYNEHTGTDIAIKNISKMRQGVDVVAAASGVVIATRDGVPDKNALSQDTNQLQNIGCGNRVAIKHSGNWITDYCHMKRGSIKVKKGENVKAGQPIGQIGLSGLTEFPHLHINVQKNNQFYDPFTGNIRYTHSYNHTLWTQNILKQLTYKPLVVYNVGVSSEIPNTLNIRNEKYKSNNISSNSEMVIIWLDTFHVEKGDIISVGVKNSNGVNFLSENVTINKPNAEKLMYVGLRKPNRGFKKGRYSVKISFARPYSNVKTNEFFNFNIY